jgi:hypothetical protein
MHSISIKELILKPYTKFELKPNMQTRRRRRGESLPGKPGGTGFAKPVAPVLQNRWHRFWVVYIFRCAGANLEIPEISPEIPDFLETLEKSPDYPRVH